MTNFDRIDQTATELKRHARAMLRRVAERDHMLNEPTYALIIRMAEQMIDVLVEALATSGVNISVAAEVVEKFVLGVLPSSVQAESAKEMFALNTDLIKRSVVGGPLSELFGKEIREARGDNGPETQIRAGLDAATRNYGTPEAARRFGESLREGRLRKERD